MDKDYYEEDMADLIENVLAPLEKYFASLVDIGYGDQEPRRVFVDDIGKTGLALTCHAQDEIRDALDHLHQKVGRIRVRRAGYQNRIGMRPRKIIDVDFGGDETSALGEPWAKQ